MYKVIVLVVYLPEEDLQVETVEVLLTIFGGVLAMCFTYINQNY